MEKQIFEKKMAAAFWTISAQYTIKVTHTDRIFSYKWQALNILSCADIDSRR